MRSRPRDSLRLPMAVILVLATAACTPAAGSTPPSSAAASASSAPSAPVSSVPAPASPSPAARPSEAADWTLAALGDSIVSEADGDGASYPDLYGAAITERTGRTVAVLNLADGSFTSGSLLTSLQAPDGAIAKAVAAADIITITVGGNDADPFATYPDGTCAPGGSADACLAAYNPDIEANYRQILALIGGLREGRPTAVRVTSPDYNAFVGWAGSPSKTFGVDFYRQVVRAETDLVCRLVSDVGAACADFLTPFNGPDGNTDAAQFLADDHLHPNLAGRTLIAETLIATGLAPLE